jgi:hypothetical protein
VPAISAAGEVSCCARCARCGHALLGESRAEALAEVADQGIELSDAVISGAAREPSMPTVDWFLDEEIQRLRRQFKSPAVGARPELTMSSAGDLASAALATSLLARREQADEHQQRPSIVAWAILSLGLMAFVCGGVLLAWSFVTGRSDLWNLGMPATLVGQFGLLLGLALQLDHLWQANRRTATTLDDVDHRLDEINHATTLLRTSHTAPGQSFYAHMAEGANPQLLLADLKGQLDLLALKMASQR